MTESFAICIGGAFGLLYMGVLWAAVRILTSGQSVWLFAALGLLRAGLLVSALWLAIWSGATAVDIAFGTLGFIAVRLFATRFVKPAQAGGASWK
ncbi:ATP synthase subunit I [Marivita sp.]|uniref:N-ATPase subunit AtpR n=1 Tax=Marivita sp. TaxID=2003365 RepID=UPI0025C030D3|nr:ATP synthase subunit I [Marivita sp.]